MRSTGRLVDSCPHASGWDSADGEERCRSCGTRRFTHYGALLPPGLPVESTPAPRDKARSDRLAAIAVSRRVYRRLSSWACGGAMVCLTA
ncbi:DUF6255 family natural product biosynthesis protein [Streptomyces sp. NPDC049577]|uniref:DUF6255 family natural product biosynthesis protein n=1 Tax=Streptomyces sp. NPDC049577 TaxID=3155153 RepID=UPI00341B0F65